MNLILRTVAMLLAVISNLASVGSKIAIEKDWVVVIANNDIEKLTSINSIFRTIDLICLLVAPALIGLVFDFLGNAASAMFIGAWNILSLIFEHFLMMNIYKNHPGLRDKPIPETTALIGRLNIIL
jgi:iron-regulated transporter 1